MTAYSAELTRNGIRFRADMYEDGPVCIEQVHAFDVETGEGLGQPHGAMFDTSNLGSANRDEYVRVMLASVVGEYFRKVAP